jgi:hypothetical protein
MADPPQQRVADLLFGLFGLLSRNPDGLRPRDAFDRLQFKPGIVESTDLPRIERAVRRATIRAVKVGWLEKRRGVWVITTRGRRAKATLHTPSTFAAELERLYAVSVATPVIDHRVPPEPIPDRESPLDMTSNVQRDGSVIPSSHHELMADIVVSNTQVAHHPRPITEFAALHISALWLFLMIMSLVFDSSNEVRMIAHFGNLPSEELLVYQRDADHREIVVPKIIILGDQWWVPWLNNNPGRLLLRFAPSTIGVSLVFIVTLAGSGASIRVRQPILKNYVVRLVQIFQLLAGVFAPITWFILLAHFAR